MSSKDRMPQQEQATHVLMPLSLFSKIHKRVALLPWDEANEIMVGMNSCQPTAVPAAQKEALNGSAAT